MTNERRKELLRSKILEAAKTVFLSQGFAEAKISTIADAAHVSPSTIYLYFSGKKALFDALELAQSSEVGPERQQKHTDVVRVALATFGALGFENTSMVEIAARAGISKAALYLYCTGKEDLFLQTLDYYIATGFQTPYRPNGELASLRDYFHRAAKSCITNSGNPERNAFLGAVIRDSKKFPVFGKVYYEHSYCAARASMVTFLTQHRDLGHLRPGVNLTATADVFLGILMSYVVLFRIVGGIESDVDEDAYINRTVEIFLHDLEA